LTDIYVRGAQRVKLFYAILHNATHLATSKMRCVYEKWWNLSRYRQKRKKQCEAKLKINIRVLVPKISLYFNIFLIGTAITFSFIKQACLSNRQAIK
jgi:hypothetical protein